MKKLLTAALILVLCLMVGGVSSAGKKRTPEPDVGVVIVGSADYTTEDFLKSASEAMGADYKVGQDIQQKLALFWFERGVVEERATMTKEEMIDFARYSGLRRVIYVVTGNPKVENSSDLWSRRIIRASMNARVIVMEGDGTMVDIFGASQNGDSSASELRAKRDCFKKIMREVRAHIENKKGGAK